MLATGFIPAAWNVNKATVVGDALLAGQVRDMQNRTLMENIADKLGSAKGLGHDDGRNAMAAGHIRDTCAII